MTSTERSTGIGDGEAGRTFEGAITRCQRITSRTPPNSASGSDRLVTFYKFVFEEPPTEEALTAQPHNEAIDR
jgi:hypothetical protein